MANKTIPELTEVSSPVSSDVLIIHNSNLAKKIQLQNILPEVSDTDTIDLTINKTTRTISGVVKSASITNARLADVPALSIKGRKEIDSGSAQDLTLLEVQTLLNSTGAVVDTRVRALTSNWEDTYTTVRDFSGSWDSSSVVDTGVRSLTSNWEDTYTTVRDFSGSWDNTFNTTNSDTVNLTWDNSTRTLSADVVGSSLTTVLSSSLSASRMVAKAWVNFDGTTSPGTIRSSYNVSSVTKNGTGDYTVNFPVGALADANYSVSGITNSPSGLDSFVIEINRTTTQTSSLIRVRTFRSTTGVVNDPDITCIQVFGN